MRRATLKYQIWQIMLTIAVLAGLFGSIGAIGAVTMLVVISFLLLQGFRPHETTAQLLIALCLWSSLIVISRWNLFDFDYVLGWFMD
jgi:predicted lysophospholipase L1 biosynthesis ABC-type transport system permease subunit